MRTLLLSALLVGLPAFAAAPPAPVPAEVRKLIEDLGDDDADVRKAAAKKLEGMDESVVPALRRAARSHADVDVHLRALVLARAIHARYWGLVRAMGPGAALTAAPPFGGYWFNRVQLNRDGKYAVAAGGGVVLFEVATGKEVKRVLEVGGARRALALARDGKHVLTGHTNDATFHLLELPSLRTVQTFKGHTRGLEAVALSPDGTRAASAGIDGTLRLWDVRKGTEQARLVGFSGAPRSLAFSSDGKRLLVGSTYSKVGEEPIRLFDVAKRQALWASKGPTAAVIGVAFLPGDREAVSASADGQVLRWDLNAGQTAIEGESRGDAVRPGRLGRRQAGADGWLRRPHGEAVGGPDGPAGGELRGPRQRRAGRGLLGGRQAGGLLRRGGLRAGVEAGAMKGSPLSPRP